MSYRRGNDSELICPPGLAGDSSQHGGRKQDSLPGTPRVPTKDAQTSRSPEADPLVGWGRSPAGAGSVLPAWGELSAGVFKVDCQKWLEEGNMQLGASEEFPSCGLSSTVNTHDEEDALSPGWGSCQPLSPRTGWAQMGAGGWPASDREALGTLRPPFPREAFQQKVSTLQRKILTL